RPHTSDYISQLIEDFVPLSGDRMFGEDGAIIGGLGRFRGTSVMVLGHEKGKDTEERVKRNFGMPRPEGYRKAKRLMDLAQRFQLPLITFVDTAGAHPGVDAEERGQSEAIAACIEKSLTLDVPIVSVIIGEGGSGGAIALATANSVMMLAYSIYSVISPEGCASILWRTRDKAEDAAKALKITAKDLKGLGVIDEIIAEPPGAAHRNKKQVIDTAGDAIEKELKKLLRQPASFFKPHRQERFVDIGRVSQKVLKYKKA
ncbi:MAG: acetyl-CoA carboxylase carboxyltransferase subunit alpha, partial [Holosporaceae bacterium]